LHRLIDERALDSTTINAARLRELKDEMERAEARRLVPHFVESFFVDAFRLLGGSLARREPGRYQVTHVPADLRRRDRQIGRGDPVLKSYERICFDKAHVNVDGRPPAALVAPGHALLDAVVDVLLERHRDVLKRGAILVDDSGGASNPRVLFSIESDITDGRTTKEGNRRVISRRVDYVEVDADGKATTAGAAPYLDYRPPEDHEAAAARTVLERDWATAELEDLATEHGIAEVVDRHLTEVRAEREALVAKTMAAVKARLTSEIQYWDHRAEELRLQEEAGKTPRLNSANARRRCDELEERLERRMAELKLERDVAAQPPVVHGGALVIPAALLRPPAPEADPEAETRETRHLEAIAMVHVMAAEAAAGRFPRDVSKENRGWDIESREPDGRLRFIEVKGRKVGAATVCVSKNELLTCLNKREQYYLAIVVVDGDKVVDYWTAPDALRGDWSFALTSQNLSLAQLRSTTVTGPPPELNRVRIFDEFQMLNACALRFDGYHWAGSNALDPGTLMNSYWQSESFAELFNQPDQYQLAVWFLQQRSIRWNDSGPPAEPVLGLWRQLFLKFGHAEPPEQGTESEAWSRETWRRDYGPWISKLQAIVRDRIEHRVSGEEPIRIEAES
jgi:hypothetical protein